ncbi:MAG: acetyl-CoA carboxylase carboxyltransferase subunit alpha [Planctomycetes bacterium]|nr:acetyl-CoA carboxylase carboxyltransferase subunit alpha [Planctomycetota bacterium]NOG55109.1 acetyl-CoA carboxylase carboxyltransferase subunit alpha [Planctomycetota bacterium]
MSATSSYGALSSYRPEFEKPLMTLEQEIESLEDRLAGNANGDAAAGESETIRTQIADLKTEHRAKMEEIYSNLGAWEIVSQVARHPKRPQSTDYLRRVCSDFCQLHGDRHYGDDAAILTGFARIGSEKVMIVAHRKGRDTNERQWCNFGCAHPEGYRKALKNMKLAEKFGLPIVSLVDTKGAYPGIGAEERGQAEAIAVNLREMSRLKTPIVSVIIGEGGSGGALGIAVADQVGMLQFAWYSVISPEGCAAILWKQATPTTNSAAADALHLTATENLKLGIIDEIIPEPIGGAHRDHEQASETLQKWLVQTIQGLKRQRIEALMAKRYDRLRKIGSYSED